MVIENVQGEKGINRFGCLSAFLMLLIKMAKPAVCEDQSPKEMECFPTYLIHLSPSDSKG